MVLRLFCFCAMSLVLTVSAQAHNTDCNGKTQPAALMSGCCGEEDYRALKATEVRPDGLGWDVWLDGKWREVRANHKPYVWIVAQPTLAACWGVWYRKGTHVGPNVYYYNHDGNADAYAFYCLEQPATD